MRARFCRVQLRRGGQLCATRLAALGVQHSQQVPEGRQGGHALQRRSPRGPRQGTPPSHNLRLLPAWSTSAPHLQRVVQGAAAVHEAARRRSDVTPSVRAVLHVRPEDEQVEVRLDPTVGSAGSEGEERQKRTASGFSASTSGRHAVPGPSPPRTRYSERGDMLWGGVTRALRLQACVRTRRTWTLSRWRMPPWRQCGWQQPS